MIYRVSSSYIDCFLYMVNNYDFKRILYEHQNNFKHLLFFLHVMYKCYNADDRFRGWPFMDSPVSILCVFVLYLVMVRQGPKKMEQRKPFQVQGSMILYNLAVMVLSIYIAFEVS